MFRSEQTSRSPSLVIAVTFTRMHLRQGPAPVLKLILTTADVKCVLVLNELVVAGAQMRNAMWQDSVAI
jgi:hypothetical protein